MGEPHIRPMFYPNMNLLRYLLSLGILINHFNVLGGHDIPYFISHDRIGGFFALSGFLMYPSYVKLSGTWEFVKHRARRILPTYVFIVLLCAALGVFVSSLSFQEYFTNKGLLKYLAANLTFLNWLCPSLPGVFSTPEFVETAVNGSLWTMKVEWLLDLSVPFFVWFILKTKWRKTFVALALIVLSMLVRCYFWALYQNTGSAIYEIMSRQFFGQMGFFYMGMLIYFKRDFVSRYKRAIILFSLVLYIIGPLVPYGNIFIAPLAVPLLLLAVSMIGRTIKRLEHRNCISYNIFLIHYPVIQVAIYLGINDMPTWISLIFVLVVTIIMALFTNRFIDRRFLSRRR